MQVDQVGGEGEEKEEERQGVGERSVEQGGGGGVVARVGVEEDLKEGEVGSEKDETDNRVEQEDFSCSPQQLLHVDPAPLCLREPTWHLVHDGGVEGVANRDQERAGCLPDAGHRSTSPAGKQGGSEGDEGGKDEAGEQGGQLHL